ncbi:MAG: 30S ribosomal protein S17 [Terriglobales bacterium]
MAEAVKPAAASRQRNEKIGAVVSARMAKTIVVEVTLRSAHHLYRRGISKRHKFYAHDERGQAKVGDVVRIEETRPLSRLKRWRLVEIVRQAAALPTREEIARAVGEAELSPDTRKPAPSTERAGKA